MSNVPGINAKHAIITPTCRHNRGNAAAFDEALGRIWTEYCNLLAGRGEDGAHYHLVLAVEDKKPLTPTEKLQNIRSALDEAESNDDTDD